MDVKMAADVPTARVAAGSAMIFIAVQATMHAA